MYTTTQIATLFQVTSQTAKRWTAEFARYLSVGATPEPGHVRKFSDADLEVFALVAVEKQRGRTFEDIHAMLTTGQRGTPPDVQVNALVAAPPSNQLALMNRVEELESELVRLRDADSQNRLLKQQLAEAQAELKEAYK